MGYSVQIGGGNQVVVSSTSNYKTDRDIATTLGNFDAGKKNIASGSGHIAIIPVRFNLKDKKYQLLKDPEFAEPYTFQPETDTQPADRFVIFQAGPDIYPSSNDRCNDDFLEELNFSNNSFRLSLLETEKMTNNHQLKIVYNGVSSNYSNDKWICDDKKIKKAIASVNLLKLLETKKQLKDTTEIVIGPELATAQKSLQENPQAFFENLIEVFGDGPNATLFYANIGEILTNE
ncbi:MAG: hypothetical protein LBJ32_02030, partial [Oscillospiraceae bacterium]|nr:hypothetical protein [Oscillospiraceae bacterium]